MALPTDSSWWPSGSAIFDFSLKFEETILEIAPSSLFLLSGSIVYLHYRQKPIYIHDGPLLWLKLVRIHSAFFTQF